MLSLVLLEQMFGSLTSLLVLGSGAGVLVILWVWVRYRLEARPGQLVRAAWCSCCYKQQPSLQDSLRARLPSHTAHTLPRSRARTWWATLSLS